MPDETPPPQVPAAADGAGAAVDSSAAATAGAAAAGQGDAGAAPDAGVAEAAAAKAAPEQALAPSGQPAAPPRHLDEATLSRVRRRLRARATAVSGDGEALRGGDGCFAAFLAQCDSDGAGGLSPEAWARALRGPLRLGPDLLPEEALAPLFAAVDADRDGRIGSADLDAFAGRGRQKQPVVSATDATMPAQSLPSSPRPQNDDGRSADASSPGGLPTTPAAAAADGAPAPNDAPAPLAPGSGDDPSQQQQQPPAQRNPAVEALAMNLGKMMHLGGRSRKLFGKTIHDARSFFEALDRDGSGTLTRAEVKDGILRLGVHVAEAQLQAMFQVLDGDNNDSIEIEEFVALFGKDSRPPERDDEKKARQERAKRLREAAALLKAKFVDMQECYDELDADGNGGFTKREFIECLGNHHFDKQLAAFVFSEMEKDAWKSGKVTLAGLELFWHLAPQHGNALHHFSTVMRQNFINVQMAAKELIGPNPNSETDVKSFMKAVEKYGFGVSEASTIFQRLDAHCGGRGKLGMREFAVIWNLGSEGALMDVYEASENLRKPNATAQERQKALEDVRACLGRGALSSEWSGPGTPLQGAVECGSVEFVRELISHGADVRVPGEKGITMLHLAAFHGHAHMCSTLAKMECDVNAVECCGQTPLFFAATQQVCDALVASNADLDLLNNYGQTCLHLAAKGGLSGVLRYLADRCSPEIHLLRDQYGASAEYYARHAGLDDRLLCDIRLRRPALGPPNFRRGGRSALEVANDPLSDTPRSGTALRDTRMRGQVYGGKDFAALPPWMARRCLAKHHAAFAAAAAAAIGESPPSSPAAGADARAWPPAAAAAAATSAPGSPVAQKRKPVVKKPALDPAMVRLLRSKFKAAAHCRGGFVHNAESLLLFLKAYDKDGSEEIDEDELRTIMRRGMRVPATAISDEHVHGLFKTLDADGSGSVNLIELVGFVYPHFPRKMQFLRELATKLEKVGIPNEHVLLIKEKAEQASEPPGAKKGVLIDTLIRKLDVDNLSHLSLPQAMEVMRHIFEVRAEELTDDELKAVLKGMMHEGSSKIDIDEIIDLVDIDRVARMTFEVFEERRAKGHLINRTDLPSAPVQRRNKTDIVKPTTQRVKKLLQTARRRSTQIAPGALPGQGGRKGSIVGAGSRRQSAVGLAQASGAAGARRRSSVANAASVVGGGAGGPGAGARRSATARRASAKEGDGLLEGRQRFGRRRRQAAEAAVAAGAAAKKPAASAPATEASPATEDAAEGLSDAETPESSHSEKGQNEADEAPALDVAPETGDAKGAAEQPSVAIDGQEATAEGSAAGGVAKAAPSAAVDAQPADATAGAEKAPPAGAAAEPSAAAHGDPAAADAAKLPDGSDAAPSLTATAESPATAADAPSVPQEAATKFAAESPERTDGDPPPHPAAPATSTT